MALNTIWTQTTFQTYANINVNSSKFKTTFVKQSFLGTEWTTH